ncbi:hypothetical protein NPIL_196591 [Nephila pilipes]|uniref:Uncharacterized protein n=1 Tax=Nephila pilipes TaxID=299642 RepID=A0A8X6TM27_NEPPI|nr:hypothetical protein NPIL_196591 [Nephila pilipes]
MGDIIPNARNEFAFIWRIENFSYCTHTENQMITSPQFAPSVVKKCKWFLNLRPYKKVGNNELITCAVQRHSGEESENFRTNFEIAFLAADGSLLKSTVVRDGYMNLQTKYKELVLQTLRTEVLQKEKDSYLPQDILTIRYRMWSEEGCVCEAERVYARSLVCIERALFMEKIKQFNSKILKRRHNIKIKSKATGALIMRVDASVILESYIGAKIIAEINVIYISIMNKFICKFYLLDDVGNRTQCGVTDLRCEPTQCFKNPIRVPLIYSKQQLMDKKSVFFPKDVLCFQYEFCFANGRIMKEIEGSDYNFLLTPSEVRIEDSYHASESFSDDMRYLYDNKMLCDIELKTRKKTFFAHKLVLCARSSFFRSSLTNGDVMTSSEFFEVDDLEEETLNQFLYFLYTGHLKNLQWEMACKLYYASDKYGVQQLKWKCATFFMSEIHTRNACEVLVLADKYRDSFLKTFVVDFILRHDEEIFLSDAWTDLKQSNIQLVGQTMLSKYRQAK